MIPHNSYLAITIANKEADLKRPHHREHHHAFDRERLSSARIDRLCPGPDCHPIAPGRLARLLTFLRVRSPHIQPNPTT